MVWCETVLSKNSCIFHTREIAMITRKNIINNWSETQNVHHFHMEESTADEANSSLWTTPEICILFIPSSNPRCLAHANFVLLFIPRKIIIFIWPYNSILNNDAWFTNSYFFFFWDIIIGCLCQFFSTSTNSYSEWEQQL